MTREEAIEFIAQSVKSDVDMADVADAIKALKQEPRWIPVSERLPEEREWIGTKQFGTTKSDEVYVTFETPKGDRFTKHLSFQNGKLSASNQQTINKQSMRFIKVLFLLRGCRCRGGTSMRNLRNNFRHRINWHLIIDILIFIVLLVILVLALYGAICLFTRG